MFQLFYAGGPVGMSIITILFVAVCLSAWKAPAWVKEFGILAMLVGVVYSMLGAFQICAAIQVAAMPPAGVMAGGIKVSLIPVIYGIAVYAISLVIRIIQKPRI